MTHKEARARAKQVGEMRHVAEWIEEFQRVCSRMPVQVFVFAGEGSGVCSVMAKDVHGNHIENTGGGLMSSASITDIKADIEGGGF
jgi:hypothetical protein